LAGAQDRRRFSSASPNDYVGYGVSLRQRVFRELDKNPLLTPLTLRSILRLDGKRCLQVLANYKTDWRRNYRNMRGLNCLSFHNVHGNVRVPLDVSRVDAVKRGWVGTRARNRMFIWKDDLGRLEWFETGLVKVWVRKPATEGKAVQLLANGFTKTELIWDMRVWEKVRRSLWFYGATLAIETGVHLPYVCVDLLRESNGVKVKMGDASDPTKLEIDFCYPKWAERNETLFEQITEILAQVLGSNHNNSLPREDDYVY
jgi:hypothetical protein